ncbi:MAG: endonuclease V [candidate division WOR-3 bacterium]
MIAGCDVAYDEQFAYAAWVVLSFPELTEVDIAHARTPISAEYRPGFFAERELPPLLAAFAELRTVPDVVLCEGAGIAHPRRFGLACALGQTVDLPTIGCAKSRLTGVALEPGPFRGDWAPLLIEGERVGTVLRTRSHVRPLYVSPGYKITLIDSWRIVLAACRNYRLPEPLRLAHSESRRLRLTSGLPGRLER